MLLSPPRWKLTEVLPGEPATWVFQIDVPDDAGPVTVSLHVPHPMPGGKPLRFANEGHDADGVLTIAKVPPS